MRAKTWIIAALAASCIAATAGAQPPPDPGVPPAVLPHCLSRNPGSLALTPDQLARIDQLLRAYPESPTRRAAIIDVLSETQKIIYRNTAGITAC